jgi:hypothetical protein
MAEVDFDGDHPDGVELDVGGLKVVIPLVSMTEFLNRAREQYGVAKAWREHVRMPCPASPTMPSGRD